jgi:hypothetical protein
MNEKLPPFAESSVQSLLKELYSIKNPSLVFNDALEMALLLDICQITASQFEGEPEAIKTFAVVLIGTLASLLIQIKPEIKPYLNWKLNGVIDEVIELAKPRKL